MTSNDIRRASLADIRKMKEAGQLHDGPAVIDDTALPPEFWDEAEVVAPPAKTSVHLKLDRDVFDYFKAGGKGHLTRMQNVLAAYVKAKTG